ncbi:hypothetical protein ACQUD0_10960 [Vagococcus fluvialis]|uniref:hypothetical protein n=1 Tax=Vagococcus fluvialis TaxID=2738 RepID=UPI003D12E1FD
MDTNQALERLEQAGITSSKQMLRRWLRQGKIESTLISKKQGYDIDEKSLKEFIVRKQFMETDNPLEHQLAYQKGYQAGVLDGRKSATAEAVERRDAMIAYQIKEYEKSLILKKCYEETIEINYFAEKTPLKVKRALDSFGSRKVYFGILGQFALFEGVDLIELADLPYPNRTLHKRLENWLVEQYK